MSRIVHRCVQSLPELLARFPLVGLLLAPRASDDCIATRIVGLGACRSVYCKPVRVVAR